jgi:hypothetical protein
VVGVGRDPGLHRMIDYLAQTFGVPIRAVTFDVFDMPSGGQVIVREEIEAETSPVQAEVARLSATGVIDAAGGPDSPGGQQLMTIVAAGERNGLYARAYRWSFMLTPQQNKSRGLLVFGRWSGQMMISHNAEAISEFFPITVRQVEAILGPSGLHTKITSDQDAKDWATRLDTLFRHVNSPDPREPVADSPPPDSETAEPLDPGAA